MGFFRSFKEWRASFKAAKAKLTLSIEKRELALGEEVKGTLRIQSEEEFDIENISMSLVCTESMKKTRGYKVTSETSPIPHTRRRSTMSIPEIPRIPGLDDDDEESDEYEDEEETCVQTEHWESEEYWDEDTLYSENKEISGAIHVYRGFAGEFPFSFKLPTIGRGTYHGVDRNLKWFVAAATQVAGKRGVFARFKRGSEEILVSSPSSTTIKETVREVVLIPCKYCGGLMPQTSIFCPNCGARRTA